MRKKTHEDFVKEIYSLVGTQYTILGKYISSSTKVLIKHNNCGYSYEVTPNNFLKGRRCPICYGTFKKTTEQFKKEINNVFNGSIEVIGEYINNETKIEIRHKCCDHRWFAKPVHLLNGHGCPKCSNNSPKDTDLFKLEVRDLYEDEFCVIGEYISANSKIKIKHNLCGYIWSATPSNFLRGSKCPKCAGNVKYTTTSFREKLFELYCGEFEVMGEYINSKTKILIIHNICGYKWRVTPSSIIHGTGCPKCNKSKGEEKISNWLDNKGIRYVTQYKFDDCKFKKPLPFDFYLPDYNMCIEYDGEGHFKPFRYDSKDKMLKKLKMVRLRDEIKSVYCKDRKIKLLRLPYTEFKNINNILQEALS